MIDLLKETKMLGCKPINTPMNPNVKPRETKCGSHVDKGRYQHLAGKLMYLSHKRPDITFSVSCVSQFMQSPLKEHMDVAYRILRQKDSRERIILSENRGDSCRNIFLC